MRASLHMYLLAAAALLWGGGAGALAWAVAGAHGDALDLDRTIVAVGLLAGAWILASAAALVPRGASTVQPPPIPAPAPVPVRASPPAPAREPARPKVAVDEHADEQRDEQPDLSVLFCDIRGFTSWSEDKGASEVIAELNLLLAELSASVTATGGTLDELTGDGLMAFWGAPLAADDHAVCATRAALDMLDRLERINERRRGEQQLPFEIGVGVHSGSAIGETTSTAARLEASTREFDEALLVSRITVELLGDELRTRASRVGEVHVPGRDELVDAWAIRAAAEVVL